MTADRTRLEELMADYDLEGELGRGSFGVVWAARHRQLGRAVAVKELVATTDADQARFRREAQVLAQLRHPHVVTVYDYREAPHVRALVMEALTGGTLEDRQGALSLAEIVTVGLAAGAALHHVHEAGVLHRDVKPANVMFDAHGHVRVTDFGVAGGAVLSGDATTADVTLAGTFVGTPSYASPEQCAAALGAHWPEPAEASDQYALAATLYEALTGELPHDRSGGILALCNRKMTEPVRPISRLRPNMPPGIAKVIDRALERSPADRYRTVEDFGVALAAATTDALGAEWIRRSGVDLEDTSSLRLHDAPTTTASPAQATPSRRRRGPLMALTALLVVAVGVAGLLVADRLRGDQSAPEEGATTLPPASTPADLPQRWSMATGASVFSSPTVGGAPGEERVVVGSDDATVYAIDADSGAIAWTVDTDGPVRSSPAVTGDDVIVGANDGRLRSIALSDASIRWDTRVGFEIVSSPQVVEDEVLVGADHLYAYDLATGSRRWVAEETGPIVSSPAVADGVAVVGSEDHTVYGVDVDSGEVLWLLRTGDRVQSSPVITGGIAIIGGTDGNLYAIDHGTGELRWSADLGAAVKSSPAVAGNLVVVGTDSGSVVARDIADGSPVWELRTADRVDSSPLVVGDQVVVGSNDRFVHVMDLASGRPVARFETGGPVLSSPTELDGDVVVASYDGRIHRLGLP